MTTVCHVLFIILICILLVRPPPPQVEAAVAAAKEAFPGWSARSPEQRAQVLRKLADLMEANLEELAQAESRDQGAHHLINPIKSMHIISSELQGLMYRL